MFYLVNNIVPYCEICAPINQLSFLPLKLPTKQTYYILPVDRYITKIAGTLYPGGHLIIKNRYFNSSVTTRLRHLLLCLTHIRVTSLEQLSVAEFSVYGNSYKKVLGIWFNLVLKVQYSTIQIFKLIILCQKPANSLYIFFHLRIEKWEIILYS